MLLKKRYFVIIVFFILLVFNIPTLSQADYGFRYEDRTNVTVLPNVHSFNDNRTFGDSYTAWVSNATAGETIALYCEVSGCASGDFAFANETDEVPWEMDNGTGYMVNTLWEDMYGVYHMDTLNDSTVYSQDCSYSGTHTSVVGLYGNARTFAADTVSTCSFDTIPPDQPFTITWWANMVDTDDGAFLWLSKDSGIFVSTGGGDKWYVGTYDGDWNAALTANVDFGIWYHYALVWDGSDTIFYINGVENATAAAGNHIDYGDQDELGNAIVGTVDEVRIYNATALTPTQIREEYYNTLNISSLGAEESLVLVDSETLLFLNDTQANRTYEVGEYANFTVVTNITGGTVYMDSDYAGWEVQSGTTSYENSTYLNTIGTDFNITGWYVGNVTVEPSSQTYFFNVTIPTVPPAVGVADFGVIITFITDRFKTILVR